MTRPFAQKEGLQAPKKSARPAIAESLFAFVVVTALVSVLYRLRGIGFIERNLAVIAAVLFLYIPALLLWRRGRDLEHYALTVKPLGRGLALYGIAVAVVAPLFSIGYALYVKKLCPELFYIFGQTLLKLHIRGHCPPVLTPALRLPPDFVLSILSQLLVVALPEEFFFRGFLLGRLGEVMRPWQALLFSAALFALGHVLVTFDPAALAVFFPGLLFGLLRLWTGSVLAGTLFHATCNLLIETLHRSLG